MSCNEVTTCHVVVFADACMHAACTFAHASNVNVQLISPTCPGARPRWEPDRAGSAKSSCSIAKTRKAPCTPACRSPRALSCFASCIRVLRTACPGGVVHAALRVFVVLRVHRHVQLFNEEFVRGCCICILFAQTGSCACRVIRAKTGAVVHCGASCLLSSSSLSVLLVRWIIRRNRAPGSGTIDMCRGMLSPKFGWLPSKANITVVPPAIKKIARPTSLLTLLVAEVVMSSGYAHRRMLRRMLSTRPETHTTSM